MLEHCKQCNRSVCIAQAVNQSTPTKQAPADHEGVFALSQRSLDRLNGVHPDLVKVVKKAIELSSVDFGVSEGRRTKDRQKKLVAKGASRTMNSRHLSGHAVDLVAFIDGDVSWDWPLYHKIADAMFDASEIAGVSIEWGGNWKSFKDGPHFQLPWDLYPA